MEYTVVVHDAEAGGYWVEVPALPGGFSQGETLDEAVANARTAIRSHTEATREYAQPVPVVRRRDLYRPAALRAKVGVATRPIDRSDFVVIVSGILIEP